jgi:clan AA aspartic protease (TIGR02281 family)
VTVSDGSTWRFGFGVYASQVEQNAIAVSAPQPSAPAAEDSAGKVGSTTNITMRRDAGTFTVPLSINNALKLDFVVDSGAADVSIPADVVLTLVRTGTITDRDFLGQRTYRLADGYSLPSLVFRIRSLSTGDLVVTNVVASVAPAQGTLLLGQSFLGRFKSWSVDNNSHTLLLQGVPALQ